MKQLHFEIMSKVRGATADHIRCIMRKGAFAERDDFSGWGYDNLPSWARHDPEAFFLASDKYERKNSPAFVAVTFSLPNCLSKEQNLHLASKIMDALARGMPYMIAHRSKHSDVTTTSARKWVVAGRFAAVYRLPRSRTPPSRCAVSSPT